MAVGDVAAAEWSAGVAHEAVGGAPVARNFCLASLGQCRASVPNTQKANLAPLLAYIVEGLSLYLYSYLYLYYSSLFFITNRIVLRRPLHARLNTPPRLHHHQLSLL